MSHRSSPAGVAARLRSALARPGLLLFAPALLLAVLWFGARGAALVAILMLPLAFLRLGQRRLPAAALAEPERDAVTGLPLRGGALAALEDALARSGTRGRTTACLVLCLEGGEDLAARFGPGAAEQILRRTAERMAGALREEDVVARLGGTRFAVALAPFRRGDLEGLIRIAGRLQQAVQAPLSIDAATVYVPAALGFCLASRAPARTARALLAAAEGAAEEALRNGPSAIRAYTLDVERAVSDRGALRDRVEEALEGGEILPHFQPQISTATGEVTGFETLARWAHPQRGVLPPAEFLPAIRQAGLSARLAEVMLYHALGALRAWEAAGFRVPSVAVNFSEEELRDPTLPEKLKWELDRFDLEPGRLTVEILESVVAEAGDEVVVHNIAALARMGCGIDLDDFGTGHASIAGIRRFDVKRIKIDRSFVTRADTDPGQQRMIAAILSMAERLGLETLAEGVETIGEHAMLAQLGCGHVQGFGIARPMAQEDSLDWLARHRARQEAAPRSRQRGQGAG